MQTANTSTKARPWNKVKYVGPKPPLQPRHVWAIRTQLHLARRTRDLALFNLVIDSRLRGRDVVNLRVEDVALHDPLGQRVPVIFDSPHSGAEYPDDFGFVAPVNAVRRTEDAFVDELYREAPNNGATLLAALFPRAYIDPNRSLLDLDPSLLGEPRPGKLEPGEKFSLEAASSGAPVRLICPCMTANLRSPK